MILVQSLLVCTIVCKSLCNNNYLDKDNKQEVLEIWSCQNDGKPQQNL